MNASKIKPSMAHGNDEVLKAKAAEANRKRAQRKREQAWKEAEERARQEREAEERARQEVEEARIREEEAKMWQEAQPKAEKPKTEKKAYKQGKIKTRVDGVEFDSLAKAMAYIDPVLWGKENDYRTSCWIKINRALKKDGSVVYGGHTYELAI